ncbi:hypothetical protein D9M71_749670 [compost metagenome]
MLGAVVLADSRQEVRRGPVILVVDWGTSVRHGINDDYQLVVLNGGGLKRDTGGAALNYHGTQTINTGGVRAVRYRDEGAVGAEEGVVLERSVQCAVEDLQVDVCVRVRTTPVRFGQVRNIRGISHKGYSLNRLLVQALA